MARDFYPFVEEGTTQDPPGPTPSLDQALCSARIAVYDDEAAAPRVVVVDPQDTRSYLEEITQTVTRLSHDQGGTIPFMVIREVVENLIHAYFREPAISILDGGNTIRFADQGPGIREKARALEYGTTSATEEMKHYIRGVGSGLPYAQQYLQDKGGDLVIQDNILSGTIVTITMPSTTSAGRDGGTAPLVASAMPQQGLAGQALQTGLQAQMAQPMPTASYPQAMQGIPVPSYPPMVSGQVTPAPQQQLTAEQLLALYAQGLLPAQAAQAAIMPQVAATQVTALPQQAQPMSAAQAQAADTTVQLPTQMAPLLGQVSQVPAPMAQGRPAAAAQPMLSTPPAIEISERGRLVLSYLAQHESVGPTELVQEFGRSAATWTRELKALEDAGIVAKRGGQKRQLTTFGRSISL